MKKSTVIHRFSLVFLTLLIVLLTIGTFGFKRESPSVSNAQIINQVQIKIDDGDWHEAALPLHLADLPVPSTISIQFDIHPTAGQGLFIQSNYVHAQAFFDNDAVFEFGKQSNYPSFMTTPGKEVHIIETDGFGDSICARVDYYVSSDNELLVDTPLLGTSKELLMLRTQQFGASMILAIGQIITGVTLVLIGCSIALADKKGQLFLWLGLFVLFSGVWSFGNNNTAIALIPLPALLYITSYLALLVLPIPFFEFVKLCISFDKPTCIFTLESIFIAMGIGFAGLQLFGLFPLHNALLIYFFVLILGMIALISCVVYEYRVMRNIDAKYFILPICILTVSCLFGYVGYLFPLCDSMLFLQQIGVYAVILIVEVLVGLHVKDSLNLQQQRSILSYEKALLDIRNHDQAVISRRLVSDERRLCEQRQELLHHFSVIKGFAHQPKKLIEYVDTLTEQIPAQANLYCENSAVNAIIAHFVEIGSHYDIEFCIKTVVPHTDQITDTKLCVIFADLLENAIEACRRMESGTRFIRLCCSSQFDFLTITMDSSCEGEVLLREDELLSSVTSIVEEYNGEIDLTLEDDVLQTSLYLILS